MRTMMDAVASKSPGSKCVDLQSALRGIASVKDRKCMNARTREYLEVLG